MKFLLKLRVFLAAVMLFFAAGCSDRLPTDNGGIPPPQDIPPVLYNSPIWFPDGRFIGFNHTPLKSIHYASADSSYPDSYEFQVDSSGFWTVNPDGTNLRRIFPYMMLTPAWSPDGQWVAFVGISQIYKMKFNGTTFDTTTLTRLTNSGRNFFPAWSPDGKMIAFDSNFDSPAGANFLWVMNADGSNKRRIAYEPSEGEIRIPGWSPDGKKIVHIRYLTGTPGAQIFAMDSSGANPARLTSDNNMDLYPAFSPTGSSIAFISEPQGGRVNMWVMDSAGGSLRQLTTEGIGADYGSPFSWDPSGRFLVYIRYRYDSWPVQNGTLWICDVSTGEHRQLTFSRD